MKTALIIKPLFEEFRYTCEGKRIRKSSQQAAANIQQVRYLPALEIRTRQHGSIRLRHLHVTTLDNVSILRGQPERPVDIPDHQIRYRLADRNGNNRLELDVKANIFSHEIYYPFGGTALWATQNLIDADNKTQRYLGKERDFSGLIYFGFRYYAPWLLRWLNVDPAGTIDGINLFAMVKNNVATFKDNDGRMHAGINNNDRFGLKAWNLPVHQKLVHAIGHFNSDFFTRPAAEVIQQWTLPVSTSVIDVNLITNNNPHYNGLFSPVGLIINAAPQNILMAAERDMVTNMMLTPDTSIKADYMDNIKAGHRLINPLPGPDQILSKRNEGHTFLDRVGLGNFYRSIGHVSMQMFNEVLVTTESGLQTYEDMAKTAAVKIDGIISIPKAGPGSEARRLTNEDFSVLYKLQRVNPELDHYSVINQQLIRMPGP